MPGGKRRGARGKPITSRFEDGSQSLAIENDCPGPTAEVFNRLSFDWDWITGAAPAVRCHGDVHFGNAVSETSGGRLLSSTPSHAPPIGPGTPPTPNSHPAVPGLRHLSRCSQKRAAKSACRYHAILTGSSACSWLGPRRCGGQLFRPVVTIAGGCTGCGSTSNALLAGPPISPRHHRRNSNCRLVSGPISRSSSGDETTPRRYLARKAEVPDNNGWGVPGGP